MFITKLKIDTFKLSESHMQNYFMSYGKTVCVKVKYRGSFEQTAVSGNSLDFFWECTHFESLSYY